jgi:hypothetical protein
MSTIYAISVLGSEHDRTLTEAMDAKLRELQRDNPEAAWRSEPRIERKDGLVTIRARLA